MAIIPRRFYTTLSEDSTLVSRLFVPKCIDNSNLEESPFGQVTKSGHVRQNVGDLRTKPTSPPTTDWNNNASIKRRRSSKKKRLTSDGFISKQSDRGGLNITCEHVSELDEAETDLELYGFCDARFVNGLVPERFLPSLVTFKDKVCPTKNTSRILQDSLESPISDAPDLNGLVRQLAGWESQGTAERGTRERGAPTSAQTSHSGTVETQKKKIVACSNCGCYMWDKKT